MLTTVDLYLLHAPYGGKTGRLGAWRALTEAVQDGKVRSIGVSNYGVHHLDELEQHIKETEAREGKGKAGVLSVNQVELHPWLARPDIVQWCEKRGVILEVCWILIWKTRKVWNETLSKVDRHTHRSCALREWRNLLSRHFPRNTARLGHKFYFGGVCKR